MNARLLLAPIGLATAAAAPAAAQLVPGTDPVPHGPKGGGAISCVVNPLDDDEVLVSRYDSTVAFEYQVHRSTDGGLSFAPYNPPLLSGGVQDLTIDPKDDQTLYARADDKLFRSTDFGATWSDLGLLPFTSSVSSALGFAVPSSGTNLYAYGFDDIQRSTDNGATWSLVTFPFSATAQPRDMAVAPTDPNTLYVAASNGLWKSTDGGLTWFQPDAGFTRSLGAVVVSPFSADVVHCGTYFGVAAPDQGVWRSFDGGTTMALTSAIPGVSAALFLQYGPGGQYLWYGYFGELAWSVDLGDTWTVANAGLPPTIGVIPYRLGFDGDGNRLMPAESNSFPAPLGGGLHAMPDGVPSTWFHIGFSTGTVADVAVSVPGGPRYSATGVLQRALPGGDFGEAPGISAPITSMLVDSADPSKLLAASIGANQKLIMWMVSDWGDTALNVYSAYSTGPVEDIARDPSNPLNAIAVKNANGWGSVGILHSPLGGNGWNELAPTLNWGAREVAYDPHTPGRALALLDGPSLVESLDGGATWSAPSAPLWAGGGQAACLEFSPFTPGVLWAGDELGGLHRSEDDGATWAPLGILLDRGSEVEVHPEMPDLVWVSDDSGRVLVSGDRGASWETGSTVTGGSNATALAVDTADGSLLYGSTDHSNWNQPQASPFVRLGAGTAGSGGFVPRLWAEGSLPRMTSGSPGFEIGGDRVVGFDGGNPSLPGVVVPVLGFGSFPVPFVGGLWYPSILLPTVQLPVVLAAGTPGVGGTGSWSLPVPLPADTSLVGGLLVFQCVILDDGAPAPSGYVLSDAISVLLVP
jgi:photosystem II stability/assembly factor-like uncharacterized protein